MKDNFKRYRSLRKQDQPDPADLRTHSVNARLSSTELDKLDELRGGMRRGEYMRAAALGSAPTPIPPLNRQAWADLARSAANLNQLAKHLNENESAPGVDVDVVTKELKTFRLALLGAATPTVAQVIHHSPEGAPE